MRKAILFGSIVTLIETSDIQRESFNESFKENDLEYITKSELLTSRQGLPKSTSQEITVALLD